MNQQELRTLALERLKDAKALIGRKRWSFAHHVAGFAVECALKSCVLARMVVTGYVFSTADGREKKNLRDLFFTHEFQKLLDIAGLSNDLDAALKHSALEQTSFARNWQVVKVWKVEDRYVEKKEEDAKELYNAVTAKSDGVLQWIKKFW